MKLSTARMGTLDLVPYERNSKLHKDVDIEAIMASITRFGFNDPIGITPEGVIVEGHGRWLAAQRLGLEEVPVLILEGLEEKDYDLYRIAHNKIAQSSTFDFGLLFNVLQEITNADNPVAYGDMGFSDAIIDNLFAHFAPAEERAEAARVSMGTDGTPYTYEVIWDSKDDKAVFNAFMAKEVEAGADKSMGAEVLMAAIHRVAPEVYDQAANAYPGEAPLDTVAGNVEEHAHVG